MKENLINLLGISISGGVSIYTVVEKLNPLLQFISLIVTIGVGITLIVWNMKRIRKTK